MSATRPLLTRADQTLYGRLVRAFPGHIVLAQVALSRLLAGDESSGAGRAMPSRSRHWVADFVVCRPDFTALAVVELERTGAAECGAEEGRDAGRRKDRLLQAAGVKVVRVRAEDIPHEAALKTLVAALPLRAGAQHLMRRVS